MANLSFCGLFLGCVNYRSREELQRRWTAGRVSPCGSMLLKDSLLQAASELAVCVVLFVHGFLTFWIAGELRTCSSL